MPAASPLEGTLVSFPGGEALVLALNVQSTGQGHATIFTRDCWPSGSASGPSRSSIGHGDSAHGDRRLRVGRLALGDDREPRHGQDASRRMLAKGKTIAAAVLEAADSRYRVSRTARFNVVGTDRAHLAVRSWRRAPRR